MAKITKAQANDQELVVVRSRNTNKIERVIIPHDTQIGLTDFKDGDLTVLGRLIARGPVTFSGGVKGALNLPSGVETLQAGSNITITYNPVGTVTIAGSAGGTLTDGDKGDITVSSAGNTWTIDAGVITNAKLNGMANGTIKGRFAAGTGIPQDLTSAQATSLLDVFTTTDKGLVPAPGSSTGLFLKDDGTWAAATAGAAGSDTQVQFNDGGTALGGDSGLVYNKSTDTLTGIVVKATQFTGSLTKLIGGSDYLIAGSGITLVTGALGQVTIASKPAGSDTQIQFNDGGTVFGAEANFTYNKTSNFLSLSGSFAQGGLSGNGPKPTGNYSHAEGRASEAAGDYSHAEGYGTLANREYSHAEGRDTATGGVASHAEGRETVANGDYSHAEGYQSDATGNYSHAEGFDTTASGNYSHSEGQQTTASNLYSHAEGVQSTASGQGSHSEGFTSTASGNYSHAEGNSSTASGESSHAEGDGSESIGLGSHAEGSETIALGISSHAEGYQSVTSGTFSHAEGSGTTAVAVGSHTEGNQTITYGSYSHAAGYQSIASGSFSYAGGHGTITSGSFQHVIGKYNKRGNDFSIFVIGDGIGDADGVRGDIVRVNSGSVVGQGRVEITGSLVATLGLTGSLTKLSNGADYLVAGSNITLTTGSNGSVTIAATGSVGNSSLVKMAFNETPAGSIDGSNKTFTLTNPPAPTGSLQVFYNGALLAQGAGKDYTLSSQTITFESSFAAPSVGDTLLATYAWDLTSTTLYSYSFNESVSFTPSGPTYAATLANAPNPSSTLMLFMNGQLLTQGVSADYTLSGVTITLNFAGGVVGSDFFATYQY